MEFAGGGELFNRIASSPAQRFSEAHARFFFVQLLAGIAYVHSQAMAHRDLKLENALLMDASPRPRLAICDFGYTKSEALHSAFHTGNVGTPSYLAPELLTLKQGENYDGKAVDAWAAGVLLYVMLVGGYPFGDLSNGRELVRRIATAQYTLPVPLSQECVDLFATIFVVDPVKRATIGQIQGHAWCTADPHPVLPWLGVDPPGGLQSVEQLMALLHEAQGVPAPPGGRADDEEAAPGGDYSMPYTEADHMRDLAFNEDEGDED
jgi:serine/threonine-protein kinase SRK2